MATGKLSRAEVELTIEKILKRYDEYIYRFFKSPRLKSAFEERYFSAVRNGLDLSRFLAVEISVIEELIKKEEENLNQEPSRTDGEPKKDFADKVLEKLRERIEKYPDVRVHRDANPEIRRLVGALTDLDEKFMPELHDALKNTNYSFNSQVMMNLDSQIRSLGSSSTESVPQRLTRYAALLNVFPRDYKAIDREEKAFILEASFFLHDLLDILLQVRSDYDSLGTRERRKLDSVVARVEGIVEDFRLKDFKRKST
jgi:hypothetical protein